MKYGVPVPDELRNATVRATSSMRGAMAAVSLGFLLTAVAPPAESATWTASVSGYWTNSATWGGTPAPGDDVIIAAGRSVTVDVTTVYLNNFTGDGTLVFNGTNTALQATNVVISSTGRATHPAQSATATNADGKWYPDHRAWFVCSNLTVAAGGEINADAAGYKGSTNNAMWGYGPGGTPPNNPVYGAGYGGAPGWGASGEGNIGRTPAAIYTYGSASAPVDPGSGAGKQTSGGIGGNGGGAIRIAASGHVAVSGLITAMGGKGGNNNGAGGSGGGIYITCRTVGGAGVVRANGGDYGNNGGPYGGGGRMAIVYDRDAQASISPTPTLTCGGYGSGSGALLGAAQLNYFGWPGTIWLSDNAFFPPLEMTNSCSILYGHTNAMGLDQLVLSNAWVSFDNLSTLTISNRLHIEGRGGHFSVNPNMTVQVGSVVLTNGGRMYAYAAATNATILPYGALVDVSGSMNIHTGSWVCPHSGNPTNCGSVLFRAGSLTIATNSGFNADGLGWSGGSVDLPVVGDGFGPGRSKQGGRASAGHGGLGGAQNGDLGLRGTPYGDSNAPALPGSGTGYNSSSGPGGAGGGLVWVEVARAATLNGLMTANGQRAPSNFGGGGSGGGIHIRCKRLEGSGVLRAEGGLYGTMDGGIGGGGGRIAVWSIHNGFTGTASVTNGLTTASYTYQPEPGTIVWGHLTAPGTIVMIQ